MIDVRQRVDAMAATVRGRPAKQEGCMDGLRTLIDRLVAWITQRIGRAKPPTGGAAA